MKATNKVVYTFTQFANAVGHNDGLTREASLVFHNEYVSMTPESRKRMLNDWQYNYLIGRYDIKTADRIMSQTRDERTDEHQKAYKRANAQFDYHVKRGFKEDSKGKATTRNSVDPVQQLVAKYKAMSKTEQRRFLTQIAK